MLESGATDHPRSLRARMVRQNGVQAYYHSKPYVMTAPEDARQPRPLSRVAVWGYFAVHPYQSVQAQEGGTSPRERYSSSRESQQDWISVYAHLWQGPDWRKNNRRAGRMRFVLVEAGSIQEPGSGSAYQGGRCPVGQRELNEAIHRILRSVAMLGANHEDACLACGGKAPRRRGS
jgi:hypothetical protein